MNADDVRREIHHILDAHDEALAAIRLASENMQAANAAWQLVLRARDAAVVSAINANRAALRLLDRLESNNGGTP